MKDRHISSIAIQNTDFSTRYFSNIFLQNSSIHQHINMFSKITVASLVGLLACNAAAVPAATVPYAEVRTMLC